MTCRCATKAMARGKDETKGAFPWDRAGRPFGAKQKTRAEMVDDALRGRGELPEHLDDSSPGAHRPDEHPDTDMPRRRLQPGEMGHDPSELRLRRSYTFPDAREDEPEDENEDDLVPGLAKRRRLGLLDMRPILAKPAKRRVRYTGGRIDGRRIAETARKRLPRLL